MPTSSTLPTWALLRRIGLLIGLLVLSVAILSILPVLDYSFFVTAARAWRADPLALYTPEAPQFFYAPWSLLLTVPLSMFPDRIGNGLFGFLSLGSLIGGTLLIIGPSDRRSFILGVSAPFTAAMVLLTQWDGLIVGGVGLAWYAIEQRRPWLLGVALAIIGTKPTNALIIALVLLVDMLSRRWTPTLIMRAGVVPLICFVASFLACGLDWPIRYIEHVQASPPWGYNMSLWLLPGAPWATTTLVIGALVGLLSIPISRYRLAAALVAGLVVSPFVVPYHLVSTAPALALIARQRFAWGLALWVLSFIGIFAVVFRWTDLLLVGYMIVTMAAIAVVGRSNAHSSPR